MGQRVASQDGHPLGHVAAVVCTPDDPYDAIWFVVRRGWLRAQLRAVPAQEAGRVSDALVVPFTRDRVKHSPALDMHGLTDAAARDMAAAYYAAQPK
jgi:hypothetical protein